jgi:predicted DNA-binding protein YlxM (UPF0122 family)
MIRLTHLLKEAHEHDRDMVVGVAEILSMVDDINNRDDIADEMMDKFDREDVNYDVDEFLDMCGLSSLYEDDPMLKKPKISTAPKGVKKPPIPGGEKPKDTADRIKHTTTRLDIMKKQLTLPHASNAKTKLQRRISKTQQKLKNLKSNKG